MRSDWVPAKLSDVVDFLAGFAFKSEFYAEENVGPRLCLGANVAPGAPSWTKLRFWPSSLCKDAIERYRLGEGDVILAMDRPWIPGGLRVFRFSERDSPALLVQRVARLRGTHSLDSGYLYALLRQPAFTSYILSVQTGTTVPHVSARQILDYSFHLPPINEQRRIAATICAMDDKIELNRNMNRTLEAMARSVLDNAIALSAPTTTEASLPPGWRRTTLGELTDSNGGDVQTGPFGSQLHAADYLNTGIPSIMPQDIKQDRVSIEGIARVSESDAVRLCRYRVEPGDIICSRRGDVERRALMTERERGWLCGTGCLRIRLGGGVDPQLLYWYLGHPDVRSWIVRHAHGATMPNLNTKILRALPVAIPPQGEAQRLLGLLSPLFAKREANCAEMALLGDLRDTLLPKLISGELRIPDAEAAVADAL